MGKGDQKSKRGKITNGSYGKTRLRKAKNKVSVPQPKVEKEAVEETPKPKTTRAKKTTETEETPKPKTPKTKKTEE